MACSSSSAPDAWSLVARSTATSAIGSQTRWQQPPAAGAFGGYAAYGLAYGLASLGCTLPIFLTVVGSALVVQGFLAGLMEFLLYSLGMGFVVAALTIAAAGFKQGALAPVRAFTRYANPIGALLLLLTGAYVVYYWLTLAGLLERLR